MEIVLKLSNNKNMKNNTHILAKTVLFVIAIFASNWAFSQVGMGNFFQDLAGSSGSGGSGGGSGVPIDGGISAMIAGSVYYGYKQMKKKRNSVK
jgi:hypothetical protein